MMRVLKLVNFKNFGRIVKNKNIGILVSFCKLLKYKIFSNVKLMLKLN